MRYRTDHKVKTTERILDSAASLFRERGYAATGVDAIMASANLTAGGFYSHFPSKEVLFAKALDAAFCEAGGKEQATRLAKLRGRDWVREFASFYLSKEHRDAPGAGCPMPTLGAEVGRLGEEARAVFEQRLRERFAMIAEQLGIDFEQDHRAISAVALSVGGLILARAVRDPALSDRILSACLEAVLEQSASR